MDNAGKNLKKGTRAGVQSVGQRIRELRLTNNLTEAEFADRLGVSRKLIFQWETDRIGWEPGSIQRIAIVLGTSFGYLVSGREESHERDELDLIQLYRACTPEDRKILLTTAKRLRACMKRPLRAAKRSSFDPTRGCRPDV